MILMNKPKQLLNRLDEIGQALSKQQSALALIGLGSVGIELNRLDQFSDLDFFVIVKAGSKSQYLEDLGWLTNIAPVAYYFVNTPDGYKLLYEDGVFCEFAVFDENELGEAVFFSREGCMESKRHLGNDRDSPTPHQAKTTAFDRVAYWGSGHKFICWFITKPAG